MMQPCHQMLWVMHSTSWKYVSQNIAHVINKMYDFHPEVLKTRKPNVIKDNYFSNSINQLQDPTILPPLE